MSDIVKRLNRALENPEAIYESTFMAGLTDAIFYLDDSLKNIQKRMGPNARLKHWIRGWQLPPDSIRRVVFRCLLELIEEQRRAPTEEFDMAKLRGQLGQ